jgi:hypothetical protein
MTTPTNLNKLREKDLGIGDGPVTGQQLRDVFGRLFAQVNPWASQVDALSAAGVTLTENFRCEVANAKFSHGVARAISLKKLSRCSGAVVLGWNGQLPAGPPMVRMAQVPPDRDPVVNITLWFNTTTAANVPVTLLLLEDGQQSDSTPTFISGGGSIVTVPATLYEVDFTTQTTQNFQSGGDGNYTIDGKTWKVSGTGAAATTFGITNGTGIVIKPSASGAAAQEMRSAFTAMSSSAAPYLRNLEVWYRATFATLTANEQSPNVGMTAATGTITNWLVRHGYRYVTGVATPGWISDYYYGGVQLAAAARPRTTTNTGDDVVVIRLLNSYSVEILTGVWSSGWPSPSALHTRCVMTLFTPTTATQTNPEVNDFGAYIAHFANSGASTITVTNMRVVQ